MFQTNLFFSPSFQLIYIYLYFILNIYVYICINLYSYYLSIILPRNLFFWVSLKVMDRRAPQWGLYYVSSDSYLSVNLSIYLVYIDLSIYLSIDLSILTKLVSNS